MLSAIIMQLRTGTITRVYPKGGVPVNLAAPYIVCWGPDFIAKPGYDNQGKNVYTISVHYMKGFVNDLDDYIYNTLQTLLHKQSLLTRDNRTVKLYLNGEVSDLIEGNADGTISKERNAVTAGIYIH
jgi:hypothetical protein